VFDEEEDIELSYLEIEPKASVEDVQIK